MTKKELKKELDKKLRKTLTVAMEADEFNEKTGHPDTGLSIRWAKVQRAYEIVELARIFKLINREEERQIKWCISLSYLGRMPDKR